MEYNSNVCRTQLMRPCFMKFTQKNNNLHHSSNLDFQLSNPAPTLF